jgi:hypothetical protein
MPSRISGNCSEALRMATAQRQLQPAAERHAVERGDHGLCHAIDVQQEPRAVARILRRGLRIAEHLWKSPDIGAGGKSARAVASDDKAMHRGIALALPDHAEDLVGQFVVQRVERFGAPDGDDFHAARVIDQNRAMKIPVVGRSAFRQRQARPFFDETLADAAYFRGAELAHQFQRAGFEAKREAAAELEVGRLADIAIENVAALRNQNAEQAVADRRRGVRRNRHGFARRYRGPCPRGAEYRRRPIVLAFLVGLQRIGLDDDRIAVREVEHEERPGMDELRRRRIDLGGAGAIE